MTIVESSGHCALHGVKVSIRKLFVYFIAIFMFPGSQAFAGEIYSDFPSSIDADAEYLIYSHGGIVEGEDPRPRHERWGVYDFPAIKSKLAEDGSIKLIAYHRRANTDVANYVERLKSWVNQLVEAGVHPERITLMGFSRGGQITALASSQLKPLPINTILLATCWKSGVQEQLPITFSGRFLSIYETTDVALSCGELAARSNYLTSFQEIRITTGKEHGAFYLPRPEWIEPVLQWIQQGSDRRPGGTTF